MSCFKLLVTVVPHDKGDMITQAARDAGAGGGTVLMGRHMASSNLRAVFGLGESSRDVILNIVDDSTLGNVRKAIKDRTYTQKSGYGSLMTINVESIFRNGVEKKGEGSMSGECCGNLIAVIINKGYADDVMAAARKAGAGGGTVINARGTAREEDGTFFGVHIVPEKEMLIIAVDSDKKQTVLDAVKQLKCISEKGSGIAFCTGVEDFTVLGGKNI